MLIRRRVNGGEWEEIEVEFGVLEADDDEPLECMYCDSPAMAGHYTCGRASCVESEIVGQVWQA